MQLCIRRLGVQLKPDSDQYIRGWTQDYASLVSSQVMLLVREHTLSNTALEDSLANGGQWEGGLNRETTVCWVSSPAVT